MKETNKVATLDAAHLLEQFIKTHGWKTPPYPEAIFTKFLEAGHLLYLASQAKDTVEKQRLQTAAQRQF